METRLRERLGVLAISASEEVLTGCAAYLRLLHRWNQRVNLTGFDLAKPTDEALDRLIAEPLAAARLIESGDRTALDIGTGSGSPAIPLKLACPWLLSVWYESRAKKSAFLREAVRVSGCEGSRW